MKTSLLTFFSQRSRQDASAAEGAIGSLENVGLVVERTLTIGGDDKLAFQAEIKSSQAEVVVVLPEFALFDVAEALSFAGYRSLGEGFFEGKNLVAVADGKDLYEKLSNKLAERRGDKKGRLTFKVFGLTADEIRRVTNRLAAGEKEIYFTVSERALDAKADLFYSENAPKMRVDRIIKDFLSELGSSVYAEDDVSLFERFHDLMKLRRLTVSTAESMTGGLIAAKIVGTDGASDIFYEGMVTYATIAKERRLGVSHKTVVEKTVVSSEIACEMAMGLMANCDVAITITGYAGSSAHPDKNDGLCFIGIGVFGKVEVYRFKFDGGRRDNIEKAANTAVYLALKTVLATD